MSPEPTTEDEDYASSEDSDFAPEDAPGRDSSTDSSGDEGGGDATRAAAAGKPPAAKRKRQAGDGDAEDPGFENSGDEAVIRKGAKRRKRDKARQQGQPDRDGEEDEGPLIKTRSMRAVEKAERRANAVSGPVTIDVDALWAQMSAVPIAGSTIDNRDKHGGQGATEGGADPTGPRDSSHDRQNRQPGKDDEPSEMINIKRTYNFAGKVHTEEKLVARESAEAKLYLASHPDKANPDAADEDDHKPAPRRAFRSAFEPAVAEQSGTAQRADLDLGIGVRVQARERAREAKKLNTVEKSRMDWAGFVDKEGIKDELEMAGRSKGSYAERQQFLARSDALREEEARRARAAGRV